MLKAVQHMFGRLGLVSVLLLAMAVVALPAASHACAAGDVRGAVAVVDASAIAEAGPCGPGDCADCGSACAHGCCHAHIAAFGPLAQASLIVPAYSAPAAWPQTRGAPLAAPSRLDRPPRG